MTDTARPAIRLMPKADARSIRWGAPWVYADNLVTDRRTRALAPGTIAVLQDAERQDMALVAVNPASKIMARIIDRDPAAVVDKAWFARRFARALDLRSRLYAEPFYRLIHAEADGLPGVVVDRFGDTAVIQPNAAWAEAHLDLMVEALVEVTGIANVLKNASGRARSLEGLDDESKVLRGTLAEGPVAVKMNGATYMADLAGGQKTGLFYDQRDNQAFVQRLARGTRMLDVFSHVGGFGLAGLAGGAAHVTCVDASAAALELAQQGAEAMGQGAAAFATRQGDAFDVMTALEDEGLHFDLVVCDPPAFAPSKPALEAGLRAYEKVARSGAKLVAPEGGYLALCSCSHAATLEKFRNACLRGVGRAGRQVQLIHTGEAGPDHPLHPQLAESGYLKAIVFRVLPL
ncbi:RSP_2647 family RNA methyltransferase [Poseidonocella sp. HB161398]|uniref:RSP_2647 family RNA methyltransferase n=1 Tax=Poseidonocella sp. HB161398 TaxID=2320855 RepID=UPI0011099028|nr:class I SAM-dependent rRNA methyltransferase [Poseidonocella sp. HB161398]